METQELRSPPFNMHLHPVAVKIGAYRTFVSCFTRDGNRTLYAESMAAERVSPDVAWLRAGIANVFYVGNRNDWVLVDSGPRGYADKIRHAADALFGFDTRPRAILLTHGHADHAGSALKLAGTWNVPVYAHALEEPFLTGKSQYPPKDPTVGGAIGFVCRFLPTEPVDVSARLQLLPDGEVPFLSGWRWYHTPGHAPGHVSLWHEASGTVLAGDAVATADLDSWIDITVQRRKISRPPAPFTFDWEQARQSVALLAALKARVIGAGHGAPMEGTEVAQGLESLARNFPMPAHGRYSAQPARTDRTGVVSVPPAPRDTLPRNAALVSAGIAAVAAVVWIGRRTQS